MSTKTAEQRYTAAPAWVRIYMQPDGEGLHCDDGEDVAAFLSKLDGALDQARRKGYKHGYEAAKKEDPRSMLREDTP